MSSLTPSVLASGQGGFRSLRREPLDASECLAIVEGLVVKGMAASVSFPLRRSRQVAVRVCYPHLRILTDLEIALRRTIFLQVPLHRQGEQLVAPAAEHDHFRAKRRLSITSQSPHLQRAHLSHFSIEPVSATVDISLISYNFVVTLSQAVGDWAEAPLLQSLTPAAAGEAHSQASPWFELRV
ncbi:hypothetical protein NMY22_g15197 [Coprinellus aureogranulatus]|nr:hypothetical protein NMY22_g15197 [Coprinellus aureogranulatus]